MGKLHNPSQVRWLLQWAHQWNTIAGPSTLAGFKAAPVDGPPAKGCKTLSVFAKSRANLPFWLCYHCHWHLQRIKAVFLRNISIIMVWLGQPCLTYKSRGKEREANRKRRSIAMAWLGHSCGKHHLHSLSAPSGSSLLEEGQEGWAVHLSQSALSATTWRR